MQHYSSKIAFNESAKQLDTTAKKIGRCFKRIAEILLAMLAFVVFQAVVTLAFHQKALIMQNYETLQTMLHSALFENLAFAVSLVSEYRTLAVSFLTVFSLVCLVVRICKITTFSPLNKTNKISHKSFSQRAVERTLVFSYKQHVAFLA